MRWLILLMVFFASCGNGKKPVDFLKTDSVPDSKKELSGFFRFVDTLDVRMLNRQLVHLEIWHHSTDYYWVWGNDTIYDDKMNWMNFQKLKLQVHRDLSGTAMNILEECCVPHRYLFSDEEAILESDLCVLGDFPDAILDTTVWIVKTGINAGVPVFNESVVIPVQLDSDEEEERIVEIRTAERTIRYVILDNSAEEWKVAGTFEMFSSNEFPEKIETSIFPFFGLYAHSGGMGDYEDCLTLLRLRGDSVQTCCWLNMIHLGSFFFKDGGDHFWYSVDSKLGLNQDVLTVEYNLSLLGYPDADAEPINLINNDKILFLYRYDPSSGLFIPVEKQNTAQWFYCNETDFCSFQPDEYIDFRLRQLSKTGTSTQRKILKNYPD